MLEGIGHQLHDYQACEVGQPIETPDAKCLFGELAGAVNARPPGFNAQAGRHELSLGLLDRAMEPIKRFSPEQYEQALDSWSWLDFSGKSPQFASLYGDIFLESPEGWWYLDTIEGDLKHVWQTAAEMQAVLDTPEGQDQYLLLPLAEAAERRGLRLAENEVYAFTPPLVLGGQPDAANASALDFVVAVDLAGQIHEQVRNLPPGTPISGITIS
jgi:Domain of unknown function (DUF1851)